MVEYRSRQFVPPVVVQALAQAEAVGFAHSCIPEVGRLLHTLAAHIRAGSVGEIGTGCGVGAAWIASGLDPQVPFCTVELDPHQADAARRLLAPFANVRVLQGDWRQILAHRPFALLFCDTKAKEQEPEAVLQALAPGGLLVLDDLTPEEFWPPEWRGKPDGTREFWLNDPRLCATEVRVTERQVVILATRRAWLGTGLQSPSGRMNT